MKSISSTAIQNMIGKSSAVIKNTSEGFIKFLVKHPPFDKAAGKQAASGKKLQGKILSYRQRFSHKQDILF
jgi:hypothetical protein